MRIRVLAVTTALALLPAVSSATIVFNVTESAIGVVASYSGSVDLTGLESGNAVSGEAATANDWMIVGQFETLTRYSPVTSDFADAYDGGGLVYADASSGDGLAFFGENIAAPEAYVSGVTISGSATWLGASLASLSLFPGICSMDFGNGDGMTLTITEAAPAVPLPAAAPMLLGALGLFGVVTRRRKA